MSDPATGEQLGTVPELGLAETKAAIAAADQAFKTWGQTTAKVRRGPPSIDLCSQHRVHSTGMTSS